MLPLALILAPFLWLMGSRERMIARMATQPSYDFYERPRRYVIHVDEL